MNRERKKKLFVGYETTLKLFFLFDLFKSVSYPTNNFFLCSLLDKNFGVILHHTLRDGHMIQLY